MANQVSSGSLVHDVLHRTLTHPVTLAAKRPLRNGWWYVRGMALANPALPSRVESMLFVCKGNICRSPFAALRAAQLLRQARRADIRCVSAGISTTQAAEPPREACDAAATFGCSLAGHTPLQLTRELVASHDVIVVMEAGQLIHLRQRHPEAIGRIFLLSLFDSRTTGGYARYNITDPFGLDLSIFRDCYARIDGALKNLVAAIGAEATLDLAVSGA